MPRGPRGEKRPADVIGAAVKTMRILTGEDREQIETPEDQGKNPAAVAMGKLGGAARAKSLSKRKRAEIAKKAAKTRWGR